MPTNNNKSKDNTTKSKPVKINKSTKAVFEDKRKKSSGTEQ